MSEETIIEKVEVSNMNSCWKDKKHYQKCGNAGCIYGLGLISAAVYFIQNADTFWMGVLGIVKAIVWPALFVYKLFVFLAM